MERFVENSWRKGIPAEIRRYTYLVLPFLAGNEK